VALAESSDDADRVHGLQFKAKGAACGRFEVNMSYGTDTTVSMTVGRLSSPSDYAPPTARKFGGRRVDDSPNAAPR